MAEREERSDDGSEAKRETRRAADITVTIFLGVNEPVREGSLFSPSRRLSRMFRCREVCIRRGTKCTKRRLLRAVEATNRRGVDFLIRIHGWLYVCRFYQGNSWFFFGKFQSVQRIIFSTVYIHFEIKHYKKNNVLSILWLNRSNNIKQLIIFSEQYYIKYSWINIYLYDWIIIEYIIVCLI